MYDCENCNKQKRKINIMKRQIINLERAHEKKNEHHYSCNCNDCVCE